MEASINTRKLTEKERNQLHVLDRVMNARQVSATDIAAKTGLSAATVSRVFKDLHQKRLIVYRGKEKKDVGRSPDLYAFNHEYGYLLHFCIFYDYIRGYLSDLGGNVLQRHEVKPAEGDTSDDVLAALKAIKSRLSKSIRQKKGQVLAAGFSVPGVVDEKMETVFSIPDLFRLSNMRFSDYARKLLGVPVILNNSSQMAVVGEKVKSYPFMDNLARITFTSSYGVGVGIILHNELIRGSMNYAGELGQTWDDTCVSIRDFIGGKGRFERAVDLQYMTSEAQRLVDCGKAPILAEILRKEGGPVVPAYLESAAGHGEAAVCDLLHRIVEGWARTIINLNLLINPDVIILGGGVSTENRYLHGLLSDMLNEMTLFRPNIRFSALGEDAQLWGGLHMLQQYVNDRIIYREALR